MISSTANVLRTTKAGKSKNCFPKIAFEPIFLAIRMVNPYKICKSVLTLLWSESNIIAYNSTSALYRLQHGCVMSVKCDQSKSKASRTLWQMEIIIWIPPRESQRLSIKRRFCGVVFNNNHAFRVAEMMSIPDPWHGKQERNLVHQQACGLGLV